MILHAYTCRITGESFGSVVHAESASKARYRYFLDLDDCCPDLKLTQIQVRSLGLPRTSDPFARVAKYRGVPFARVGMAVEVDGERGVIVGHNDSANFDVLMTAGPDKGLRLNCHPNWRVRYFGADGAEIGGAA